MEVSGRFFFYKIDKSSILDSCKAVVIAGPIGIEMTFHPDTFVMRAPITIYGRNHFNMNKLVDIHGTPVIRLFILTLCKESLR
jgi:hypothetical protein